MNEPLVMMLADIGAEGAIVVVRRGSRGLEILEMYQWTGWSPKGQKREDEIGDRLEALLISHDPSIVAVEAAFARGHTNIGLSQAAKGNFLRGILWHVRRRQVRWMEVPVRGAKHAKMAWLDFADAFCRAGFDMKKLTSDAGEHVRDATAIGVAVLNILRLERTRARSVDRRAKRR